MLYYTSDSCPCLQNRSLLLKLLAILGLNFDYSGGHEVLTRRGGLNFEHWASLAIDSIDNHTVERFFFQEVIDHSPVKVAIPILIICLIFIIRRVIKCLLFLDTTSDQTRLLLNLNIGLLVLRLDHQPIILFFVLEPKFTKQSFA